MRNKTTKYGRSACRDTSSAQLSQYIIPNTANSVISSKSDNVDIDSQIVTDDVYIKHAETYLSVDDIVTILVQIFEAVAELEAHGIAHRDIKPNNILIRQRVPFESDQISGLKSTRLTFESTQDPSLRWLNDKEVEMTNSHLCVALTDFGCAIRTNQSTSEAASSFNQSKLKTALTNLIGVLSDDDNDNAYINHSGNTALLAPEIACIYRNLPIDYSHDRNITGQDYARSDLWAAATLIYPLFGMSNPFVDGVSTFVDLICLIFSYALKFL
ncbi:unnamed protein product [Trichobilharzia regenti]|nr:unnamed protein product [Trichobilharzia regenti]